MSSPNEDTAELLAQLLSELQEIQHLRELQASINRIGKIVLFTNHTKVPVHVLRPSAVMPIPSELVGTIIDPGTSLAVLASDGNHYVFCHLNTRQPMLFTSASAPVSGYNLKLDEISGIVVGFNVFFITVPSEVTTLQDVCAEYVLTSVGRSIATIHKLPLSEPVIDRLKSAVKDPSDYALAKESIVRYNNNSLQ